MKEKKSQTREENSLRKSTFMSTRIPNYDIQKQKMKSRRNTKHFDGSKKCSRQRHTLSSFDRSKTLRTSFFTCAISLSNIVKNLPVANKKHRKEKNTKKRERIVRGIIIAKRIRDQKKEKKQKSRSRQRKKERTDGTKTTRGCNSYSHLLSPQHGSTSHASYCTYELYSFSRISGHQVQLEYHAHPSIHTSPESDCIGHQNLAISRKWNPNGPKTR